jgi:hypothetical protein
MSELKPSLCTDVFCACCEAMRGGALVHRSSRQDKEFHFQNWFSARLDGLRFPYDPPARNSYPDFRLVQIAEGYEVKGLAYPGRETTFDSNSQVPTGFHNGRTIFYVFGRYPAESDEPDYPVYDLVVCHGDFLNADHTYVHKNRSIRGFGSYGDIMIRDRKMYVAPTPFAVTSGAAGQQTLILPKDMPTDGRLSQVGVLSRVEAAKLIIAYSFDLKNNTISATQIDNPAAGTVHEFCAYRLKGAEGPEVSLRSGAVVPEDDERADDAV